MPSSCKLGEIVPVQKKDCKLTKTNPITILPVLSKVFEKLIHSRLASHFADVYYNNVFAYRDHHGCDTKKELDNHKVISLVSMLVARGLSSSPSGIHSFSHLKLRKPHLSLGILHRLHCHHSAQMLGSRCLPGLVYSQKGSVLSHHIHIH